jgi:hypothetical protein
LTAKQIGFSLKKGRFVACYLLRFIAARAEK